LAQSRSAETNSLKGRKPDSSRRVREVRIHFPPAESLLRTDAS
jgi:hypothetical protein